MYRIDTDRAASVMPTPAPAGAEGFFTRGNPAASIPATEVPADWFNLVQEELRAAVVAAGLVPDKADWTQLAQAVQSVATTIAKDTAVAWLRPHWSGAALMGELSTAATAASVSGMGRGRVAYIDVTNDQLRMYQWDGSAWTQVGTGLTVSSSASVCVAALTATDVAVASDAGGLGMYRWDEGTGTWSLVGNLLSVMTLLSEIRMLTDTDIVFYQSTDGTIRRYSFDGTDWSQVGSPQSVSNVFQLVKLAALNETDVALFANDSKELRTYRWDDGTETWSQVGASLSLPTRTISAMNAINGTDVVTFDNPTDVLEVYRWDDEAETWAHVGAQASLPGSSTLSIAAINGRELALFDSSVARLRAYRLDFSVGAPHSPAGNW